MRLLRAFDRVADDADAVGQRHDLDDALDRLGGAIVDLHGLLALHRRVQHGGVEHVRQLRVDAVFRRAVHLERDIDAPHVLADDSGTARAASNPPWSTSGSGSGIVAVLAIAP